MELARFFGFLHPALVHFPLVLLLVSVALEAIGFLGRDRRFTWAAQITLLVGTTATLFAFVAGNFAEVWAARDGIPQDPMEYHELLATITSWTFVFLTAGRLFLGAGAKRKWMAAYLVAALCACGLLIATGHQGAMLVVNHGAGVHAQGLPPLATHEDMAVLLQKQEPDALFYSNKMHHIFGVMVMLLALTLLVDNISPVWGERLRRFAPLLLLSGGVFLMICSDQDAWPLYQVRPFRPWSDKEVLMHKTYATLMLLAGARGLWQWVKERRGKRGDGERAKRQAKAASDEGRQLYARMMAIFALVGGGLLFTHVHSNAPYANVAAGVYIHHTVMGFLALCIGAVKLIEDALIQARAERSDTASSAAASSDNVQAAAAPPGVSSARIGRDTDANTPRTGSVSQPLHAVPPPASPRPALRPSRLPRILAWAYPVLMLIESVFLLNYNEGLPWFLGYGGLALTAPHQGLTAPLGRDRAEFVYDPVTQRLDFYILNQGNDRPHSIRTSRAQALVKVGTDATAIDLDAAPERDASGLASHYVGIAPFLRGAGLFQTQALFARDGAGPNVPPLVADFEPWVDQNLTRLHTRLAWVCPMHATEGANAPGTCRVCGMNLVPNRPPRPLNKLHDDAYRMDFAMYAPPSGAKTPPEPLTSASSSDTSGPLPAAILAQNAQGRASSAQQAPARDKQDDTQTGTPDAAGVPEHARQITQPAAKQIVTLRFQPLHADGKPLAGLDVVHTKKLHLIIASKDLAHFDHVHPVLHPDGALTLDYAFPHAGEFVLYADCTPTGDRNQVFRIPVTVAGTAPILRPLVVTPAPARAFGAYRVALTLTPDPPQTNDETQLTFTLSENGIPVVDLEPFLGAGGHCVILSEDTQGYLHSHPLDMGGARFGPSVTFHAQFPRRGVYKIWGQFQHHGKPLTADFTIQAP